MENDTTCCYAVQDKVWVHGPGAEPWEVYTVKADAPDATSINPAGETGSCDCGSPSSAERRATACLLLIGWRNSGGSRVAPSTKRWSRAQDVTAAAIRLR